MDEMSMFVEQMKRLVCQYLISDISSYSERVDFCSRFFKPQFLCLNGMSRTVEDWAKDNMLAPMFNNKKVLNLKEAIQVFGEEFYVLGSSQKIFTDYSWYKDLEYKENENCINQFLEKQHVFLMTGVEESKLKQLDHDYLKQQILEIRKLCIIFEENYDITSLDKIIQLLDSIKHIAFSIDEKFYNFILDCIEILERLKEKGDIDVLEYPTFCNAVGRSQQYLSMVKKCEY